MTLDERLDAIALLRRILRMNEEFLERHLAERGDDDAAEELRGAIGDVTAEIQAWTDEVNEILERRARIAAELAKTSADRACRRCGGAATPRSVANVEDMLAYVSDAESLDTFIPELVGELQSFCGSCFGAKLRGLEAIVAIAASVARTSKW